jgi:hypothetical protein
MIIRSLTGIWYDRGYKGYLVHNVVIRSLQHIIITQLFFPLVCRLLLLSKGLSWTHEWKELGVWLAMHYGWKGINNLTIDKGYFLNIAQIFHPNHKLINSRHCCFESKSKQIKEIQLSHQKTNNQQTPFNVKSLTTVHLDTI